MDRDHRRGPRSDCSQGAGAETHGDLITAFSSRAGACHVSASIRSGSFGLERERAGSPRRLGRRPANRTHPDSSSEPAPDGLVFVFGNTAARVGVFFRSPHWVIVPNAAKPPLAAVHRNAGRLRASPDVCGSHWRAHRSPESLFRQIRNASPIDSGASSEFVKIVSFRDPAAAGVTTGRDSQAERLAGWQMGRKTDEGGGEGDPIGKCSSQGQFEQENGCGRNMMPMRRLLCGLLGRRA